MNRSTAILILSVGVSPTEEEIKKAYKLKSKQYHPDMDTGDEELFLILVQAYESLMGINSDSAGVKTRSSFKGARHGARWNEVII